MPPSQFELTAYGLVASTTGGDSMVWTYTPETVDL